MKYRVFAFMCVFALGGGYLAQAQDYDDIYYDAGKSTSKGKTKVEVPAKTAAVYGEVPNQYKVAVRDNYRIERDEDEYNRRGAYEPVYELDLSGDTIWLNDTIYEDVAFANTRRIERFYNPDIVILSDDDELVELYYDESPSINLYVGSDWGYSTYGWGYDDYFPWYSHGAYYPWYSTWYSPWYYSWYSPWYHSHYYWGYPRLWGWGYTPWHYGYYGYGWGHNWGHGWGHYWGHNYPWNGRPGGHSGYSNHGWRNNGGRVGLANNRNGRSRVDAGTTSRNGISPRGNDGTHGTSVNRGGNGRGGYATGRGGNMGSRGSSGVTTRGSGGSRNSGSYSGGSSSGRSYSGGSSSGRSSGGSYSGGSSSGRSSGGSYSGGGSRGGSSGGGGGSRGGSSGGGGRRR